MKGWSHEYTRLTEPLIRENGELRTATWSEAVDRAADGFRAAVDRHGPDTVGMFSCSKESDQRGQLRRAEVHPAADRHQQHRLV